MHWKPVYDILLHFWRSHISQNNTFECCCDLTKIRENYNFSILGYQIDVKKNEYCQIRVDPGIYNGWIAFGCIHDSPEFVSKTIHSGNPESPTPFLAWTSSQEKTIYREVFIEVIGNIHAAIVYLNNESLVNLRFPILSSDLRSKFYFKWIEASFLNIVFFALSQILETKRQLELGKFFSYH